MGLTAESKQTVCDNLVTYSGPGVDARFAELVELAYGKQVAAGPATQMETNGKRERDDGSDVSQPPNKKARLAEAMAPLKPFSTSIFGPQSAQSSLFGVPTSASIGATASSSVSPLSSDAPSSTVRENSTNTPAHPASSTATPTFGLGQSITVKTETSAKPPSDCDEQFTFADRISFGPRPYNGPATMQEDRPSAQTASSSQKPAALFTAPPQGSFGSAVVSTVYKPPFSGVDMSSLKVPANSNVNLNMNVFQGPSTLHQNMEISAPRKLKCIQCKEVYIEAQNTAKECRRHTGMRPDSDPVHPQNRNDGLLTLLLRSLSPRRRPEVRLPGPP